MQTASIDRRTGDELVGKRDFILRERARAIDTLTRDPSNQNRHNVDVLTELAHKFNSVASARGRPELRIELGAVSAEELGRSTQTAEAPMMGYDQLVRGVASARESIDAKAKKRRKRQRRKWGKAIAAATRGFDSTGTGCF